MEKSIGTDEIMNIIRLAREKKLQRSSDASQQALENNLPGSARMSDPIWPFEEDGEKKICIIEEDEKVDDQKSGN